jgi:hypothetical protein
VRLLSFHGCSFHGCPLRGTGSNLHSAELASTLAGLGYEVHLLCQDQRGAAARAGFGWPDVASGVTAAAQGRLGDLPPVPSG